MEVQLGATQDRLLDSLNFSFPGSSNYIIDKKMSTYYPTGGTEFRPDATKLIKFSLTGTDWLDPQSLRVQFTLQNGSQLFSLNLLNPLAANFIRRVRIICNGQLLEDIDYYHRMVNMFHTLYPAERRMNDYAEQFGLNDGLGTLLPGQEGRASRVRFAPIDFTAGEWSPNILGGQSRTVLMPVYCGLFSQTKFLPLKLLQKIDIEMEIVNSYDDPIVIGDGLSNRWNIIDPQIKVDIYTLDAALDNQYTDFVLSGGTMNLNITSFINQVYELQNSDRPVVSISRAFTRLNKVYITFYRALLYQFVFNEATNSFVEDTDHPAENVKLKEQNFFYHPQYVYQDNETFLTTTLQNRELNFRMFQGFTRNDETEVQLQLQIGSKMIPEQPIRTSNESFYHLRKSLHEAGVSHGGSFNILDREYRTTKFINCFDCRRSNAFASGINTRTGDLITTKVLNFIFKGTRGEHGPINAPATKPQRMYITCCFDVILAISDTGVQILE